MEEYEVKSTLPEFFENFKSKVVVEPLDVDKLPFDPTKILDRAPKSKRRRCGVELAVIVIF